MTQTSHTVTNYIRDCGTGTLHLLLPRVIGLAGLPMMLIYSLHTAGVWRDTKMLVLVYPLAAEKFQKLLISKFG